MRESLREIDRLLRGQLTRPEDLAGKGWSIRTGCLTATAFALGASYGVCMGLFALLRGGIDGVPQLLATTLKVPLLFLLTLLVTFPSLYVFAALFRTSLRFADTLRLLLAAIAVNLALLASLGPVVAFFTLSTTSYPFMLMLNVLVFTICGCVGLGFLRQSLRRLAQWQTAATRAADSEAASPAPRPAADGGVSLLRVWVLVFAVVGAQMGWILRPFVGDPGQPFTLFRARESNFFAAVAHTLRQLLQ